MIPNFTVFLFRQVNPSNAHLVVGQLLDDDCPEDFIKGLILSVRSLLPVEPLVDECEKRYCVQTCNYALLQAIRTSWHFLLFGSIDL
jgi:hypothetical protein